MLELRVCASVSADTWKSAIEVPDDALTAVPIEQLPRGWDALPAGPASKRVGDYWIQQCSSPGLLVSSVGLEEFHKGHQIPLIFASGNYIGCISPLSP